MIIKEYVIDDRIKNRLFLVLSVFLPLAKSWSAGITGVETQPVSPSCRKLPFLMLHFFLRRAGLLRGAIAVLWHMGDGAVVWRTKGQFQQLLLRYL